MISFEFSIAESHPSLVGHFPNNPVVPGVVIINEIMRGLIFKKPNIDIIELPTIKFLKILKPNDLVEVRLTEKKTDTLSFECLVNQSKIVMGQVKYKSTGAS